MGQQCQSKSDLCQVEREQLRETFNELTRKLHDEINNGQQRVLDAANKQRSLCANEIKDLQRKVHK